MRIPKVIVMPAAGLLLALAAGHASAVAGGGGGFDFGGSDDGIGLLIELVFWLILELPFPWNLIAISIVLGLAWLGRKSARAVSGLNKVPSPASAVLMVDSIDPDFLHRNPLFQVEPFREKVRTAFFGIQNAWAAQDMAPVRRWISDGIWQRFNRQFEMMRLLEQSNRTTGIDIKRIFIDRIEQDGRFDIIHAGIHYTAHDVFSSARHPSLDQGGPLEILEFWSFIRRTGVSGRDLYASELCPSCGAPLPNDMGEVAKCPSCGAVSSLGDYDWVLAEITQADDYANRPRGLDKAGPLTGRIRNVMAGDPDFSVQHVEDLASNAWMQIIGARALRQPERMRRFVGDELFARLSDEVEGASPAVYNRLYLNHVTLIDHFRRDGKDHLVLALRMTAQRVDISGDTLRVIDAAPYASDEVMVLTRDVGAERPKGGLYAHACPSCGGPVADTLDLKCGYCGNVLNSTRHEWIVTRLMRQDEYRKLATAEPEDRVTRVATRKGDELDPLFKARDFAFNNVLAILGADGAITVAELNFAQETLRRFGYRVDKLAGMISLAQQRRLPVRIPEDRRTAEKMLKLMEKAAAADQGISAVEQAMLDEVRQRVAGLAP